MMNHFPDLLHEVTFFNRSTTCESMKSVVPVVGVSRSRVRNIVRRLPASGGGIFPPKCRRQNDSLFRVVWGILLLIIVTVPVRGQDANQKALAVERQYLQAADQNIERYRKSDAVLQFTDSLDKPFQHATVRIRQTSQDFLFGCIIFPLVRSAGSDMYRPELFKQRFKDLFNFAIFPFYWSAYEPVAGREQWQRLLPVLEWARQNGITPKGHPLAWTHTAGTPNWLLQMPDDVTGDILKSRIMRIVNGYRDDIHLWDVVNEPVNTVTWDAAIQDKSNSNSNRYGKNMPIEAIADWVEPCYRWAHQANPQATLILNEFNQMVMPDVRQRFYDLVTELKRRGTPISGLGLQAHEPERGRYWYSPKQVWDTINLYAEFGYPIHITEFIPQSSGKPIEGNWRSGQWTPEAQADFAEEMYRLFFGNPAVVSVNWWGLSDRFSWQEGGGLIDEDYNPKPVYTRLRHLIHQEWTTGPLDRQLDRDGTVKFRGFHGKYEVVVTTAGGAVHTYHIHVAGDEANRWTFQVAD